MLFFALATPGIVRTTFAGALLNGAAGPSIEAAVDVASLGEIVNVAPRTTFSGGDVVVRVMQKSVVNRSLGGPTLTSIDGGGARRCIVMPAFTSNSNGVLLDEFTLLNGKTPDHGGNGRVKFLVFFPFISGHLCVVLSDHG
jgi:hypothetical protein